jgi:RNA recognition motif-containing protein
MFEACGKITKFLRPLDPVANLPTSFAFITYAQAICALRAVNLLNNFVIDEEKDVKLIVKVILLSSLTFFPLDSFLGSFLYHFTRPERKKQCLSSRFSKQSKKQLPCFLQDTH